MSILSLKERLSPIVGIQTSSIQVYHNNQLLQDDLPLNHYRIQNYDELIVNSNTISINFDDVTKVEKFELLQEEYEKLNDSVLAFKMKNKIGRFSDKSIEKANTPKYPTCELVVDQRCCLVKSGDGDTRGRIAYVGFLEGKEGYFVGVELDEPLGKNKGDYMGKQLFDCQPSRGLFLRPDQVLVGDYPELDLFDDMDEDEF
jgi:tubulin-folding cofactor B